MKSLDMRGAKKIASDNEKTTMEHPSGHHIVIQHKHLSPEHKKELDSLPLCAGGQVKPQFAGGGQISQATPQPKPSAPAQSTTDKLIELAHHEKFGKPAFADGGDVQAATPDAISAADQSPEGDAAAAAGAQVNPYVKAEMLGNEAQASGIQAQNQASDQQANVAGQMGRAQAQAAGASDQRINAAQGNFQQAHQAISQEVMGMANDAAKGHINPNDYVENMSVPGKVRTALGMLISGLGGNSGSDNVAIKYLNDQIDRNIGAQKANQANKFNVISALQAQGHSEAEAAQMATAFEKLHQANIADEIAGKFGGAQAQAKAAAIKAERLTSAADNIKQAAILKTMAGQGGTQGNQSSQIPDALDPNIGQSFYVNGEKHYANSPKEAQDLQEQSEFLDKYKQHLLDVDQFNKNEGRVINPVGEDSGKAKALNDVGGTLLTETLTKGGAGVSRMAQRFADSGPQAGSMLQDRQKGKLEQNLKMVAEEQARLKKAGLRGVQPMGKLGAK